MATINLLSDADAQVLRDLLDRERSRVRAPRRPTPVEGDFGQSPEVYLALTPAGGIPAVHPSTGTTTAATWYADCDIYRVNDANDLEAVGITRRVYNPNDVAIPGRELIVVARDKFGKWFSLTEFPAAVSAPANQPGRLTDVHYYTADATWAKPAGLLFVIAEVMGAGAGGGGVVANTTGGAGAGGGGAGGYARKKILAASLGSTEGVTIGAGGGGGSAGANGSDGGTSTFSSLSASGGAGGTGATGAGMPNVNGNVSGAGGGGAGTGSGGDINGGGTPGAIGIAWRDALTDIIPIYGGGGGSLPPYGQGGYDRGGAFADAGTNGSGNGAGGGGAYTRTTTNSGSSQVGGDGTGGLVIIWEYS
jgi:hypothetical protein